MTSSYRMELNKWLSKLEVEAPCVLDIGGAQSQVKDKVKSWKVETYLIGDLEAPHADSPAPNFILDLNWEYSWINIQRMTKGDIVFCLEVFEYVFDPVNAMKILAELTKEKAYITFPFIYPTHNPIEDDALRYTEFGIRKLADKVGFKINEMIPRRPETNSIQNLWGAERMRAAKGYDHSVTGWIVEFTK